MLERTAASSMSAETESEFARAQRERATALTRTIIKVLAGGVAFVVALSFLDSRNDLRVTFAVHGVNTALLAIAWWNVNVGRVRTAAWLITFMFWSVVAASAWLFGGLRYELSAGYVVSILVAGTTLGGRAAIGVAAASVAMTTAVLAAHLFDFLPEPISPPSLINAWISVTVSLTLGSYLVHVALKSLEDSVRRTEETAKARAIAERRFLQAQKMEPVGRLAAGVAHDFNNLLAAIATITAIVRKRTANQASIAGLLDDLERATDRAALMTRQLLAFSRARDPDFTVVEVDHLLSDVVPLISRMLGEDIHVDLALGARGHAIRADRGQLEQVVLNLAVNARDAMPSGGTLRIATTFVAERDRVRVEVTDTGSGIAAEDLPRVFEPFFTTKATGTGLGLSTVRDIVEANGGSVRVSSTVGVGTTFVVELPGHAAALAPASPSDASDEQLPFGLRVLLVEDHELVRKSTRQALEDAGFDVTAVNDGLEALALVDRGTEFDAILSDLRMPRLSGHALVTSLARTGKAIPIVIFSGHADRIPEEFEHLPFPCRFLTKPVAPTVLVESVFHVIRVARGKATTAPRA